MLHLTPPDKRLFITFRKSNQIYLLVLLQGEGVNTTEVRSVDVDSINSNFQFPVGHALCVQTNTTIINAF